MAVSGIRNSNMIKVKRNIERLVFADTLATEFFVGAFAIAAATPRLYVSSDQTLATVVICSGVVRVVAVVLGLSWLRLAIAYCVVFTWTYFIMFVFLEEPTSWMTFTYMRPIHLSGGFVALLANVWIAWRLQTNVHARQNFIKDVGR